MVTLGENVVVVPGANLVVMPQVPVPQPTPKSNRHPHQLHRNCSSRVIQASIAALTYSYQDRPWFEYGPEYLLSVEGYHAILSAPSENEPVATSRS